MNQKLKQIGILVGIAVIAAVLVNCVHPRRIPWVQNWGVEVEGEAREHDIPLVSFSMAQDLLLHSGGLFVDARSLHDFSVSHIAGAVSVPLKSIEYHPMSFKTYSPVVVYGQNNQSEDALKVALWMQSQGVTNLLFFIDGFDVWKKWGGSVE